MERGDVGGGGVNLGRFFNTVDPDHANSVFQVFDIL